MRDSYTGNLLVASSLVTDPMYAGGVCLIVHEDETTVIGVMLNRPIQPTPDDLHAVLGDGSEESQPGDPANRFCREASTELSDLQAEIELLEYEPVNKSSDELPWRKLHFGGPLSGPLVAVHQVSKYAEAETGEGIFIAAQKQHLENLLKRNTEDCRLIVGHLGWESDQLEKELAAGFWHLIPATAGDVFINASDMWSGIIRKATSRSLARWIGVPDINTFGELN